MIGIGATVWRYREAVAVGLSGSVMAAVTAATIGTIPLAKPESVVITRTVTATVTATATATVTAEATSPLPAVTVALTPSSLPTPSILPTPGPTVAPTSSPPPPAAPSPRNPAHGNDDMCTTVVDHDVVIQVPCRTL